MLDGHRADYAAGGVQEGQFGGCDGRRVIAVNVAKARHAGRRAQVELDEGVGALGVRGVFRLGLAVQDVADVMVPARISLGARDNLRRRQLLQPGKAVGQPRFRRAIKGGQREERAGDEYRAGQQLLLHGPLFTA